MITMNYLTGIVLEKLEQQVEFFQNSRLESMVRDAEDEHREFGSHCKVSRTDSFALESAIIKKQDTVNQDSPN